MPNQIEQEWGREAQAEKTAIITGETEEERTAYRFASELESAADPDITDDPIQGLKNFVSRIKEFLSLQ